MDLTAIVNTCRSVGGGCKFTAIAVASHLGISPLEIFEFNNAIAKVENKILAPMPLKLPRELVAEPPLPNDV
jgi:hypothetical protein